ncbi:transcriptional regulator, AraC family protein [Cyanobium sp. PCC 7001]|uniref:helix-turn-helix domain-containing protein n=1 Tax=Cyanobium sp. PCC 7001 TaxID=180281 RepID=UPI0001804EC2|nr:helix-turn-helix domain-containing protein [Cyanobium sp. PCC 7001]EDY37963.1 transcriptional regulator, AraC family protein [Cyanobium sp. PCC 7001]
MARSRSIDGIEDLQGLLLGADLPLTITQLTTGRLRGELLPLRLGPLKLLRLHLDRAIHAAGPKPGDRQLITLDLNGHLDGGAPSVPSIRSHGQPLLPTALFGLSTAGEIHLTTFGPCDLALVMLEREEFLRRAELLGCPVLEEALARNWLSVDPLRFTRLRRRLCQLFTALQADPTLEQPAGFARLVSGDLIALVLEALVHGGEASAGLCRPPSRIELVKAAQRWMEAHPGQPIHLEGLCREVHTSRRSLIQGFREHLGMGPISYLRLQRLHGIRRALLEPTQSDYDQRARATGAFSPGPLARAVRRAVRERPPTPWWTAADPANALWPAQSS